MPRFPLSFLPLLLAIVLAPATAPAQITDSTRIEEPVAAVVIDSVETLREINRGPKKALLWSIIPGGGQAYNRRWWKVPLVYGGLLGSVAYADFNQTRFRRFSEALENRCLGEGNVVVPPNEFCVPTPDEFDPDRISNQALIQARNNADRARQTAYIGIFVVYVLQSVEAYTDAHLQEFDISDDLSLRVGPLPANGGLPAYGLSLRPGPGKVARQETRVRQLRAR